MTQPKPVLNGGEFLQNAARAPYFSKTRCFWQKKFRIDQKQTALCNKFTIFIKNISASVKHFTLASKSRLLFINRELFRPKTLVRRLNRALDWVNAKMRRPNFALNRAKTDVRRRDFDWFWFFLTFFERFWLTYRIFSRIIILCFHKNDKQSF